MKAWVPQQSATVRNEHKGRFHGRQRPHLIQPGSHAEHRRYTGFGKLLGVTPVRTIPDPRRCAMEERFASLKNRKSLTISISGTSAKGLAARKSAGLDAGSAQMSIQTVRCGLPAIERASKALHAWPDPGWPQRTRSVTCLSHPMGFAGDRSRKDVRDEALCGNPKPCPRPLMPCLDPSLSQSPVPPASAGSNSAKDIHPALAGWTTAKTW